jgi:hypothetical protein
MKKIHIKILRISEQHLKILRKVRSEKNSYKNFEKKIDKGLHFKRGSIKTSLMNIVSKVCTKCKIEKPIDKFYKRRKSKDGLTSRCKECSREHEVNYYKKNKREILAFLKKLRDGETKEERQKRLAKRKEYYQTYKKKKKAAENLKKEIK